jgi:hypothetical protein
MAGDKDYGSLRSQSVAVERSKVACAHVWRVGQAGCLACGELAVIHSYACECGSRWGQAHPGPVECRFCGQSVLPKRLVEAAKERYLVHGNVARLEEEVWSALSS